MLETNTFGVILYCKPAYQHHRKHLHLAFGLGVRNQIHVQITDIIQELADPPAVSSLTVEVSLLVTLNVEAANTPHPP